MSIENDKLMNLADGKVLYDDLRSRIDALPSQDYTGAVEDWLEENFTNPDSPPLDRTLSVAAAAAPADLVGNLKNEINDFHDDFYDEENVDTALNSSDNVTGYISSSTGDITGAEYKVVAFDLTSAYIKLSISAYHVSASYRTAAFYSADDIEDCGSDTLIGEVFTYENRTAFEKDIPDGAKMLCVSLQAANSECEVKVIKKYIPVSDLIDGKLDKAQGSGNAGKVLKVGNDGNITLGDQAVEIDQTLAVSGKAADAKKTGDKIADVFSATAKELIYTILQAGVYTSNQATNIASLAAALYITVITKSGKTLVVSNVPTVMSITQSGNTLICA